MRRIAKIGAAVVVAVVGMASVAAQAATITLTYLTSATPSPVFGTVGASNNYITFTGSNPTYTPTLDINGNASVANADFGQFLVHVNNGTESNVSVLNFSLQITQQVPSLGGPQSLTADVTGKLKKNTGGGGGTTNFFELIWDSNSVTFPNPLGSGQSVTYTLNNIAKVEWTVNGEQNKTFNVTGTANYSSGAPQVAVPLPASAWGGIALMGLLGVTQLRRRTQTA